MKEKLSSAGSRGEKGQQGRGQCEVQGTVVSNTFQLHVVGELAAMKGTLTKARYPQI